MSNFLIGPNPVQITQTGTQDSLIQNVGNSTVYLNNISAVSPDAYGFALAPRGTVNYPTGQDLWAVTAPGSDSSLSVFYGATGVGLSEVSAVVTGDVTATIEGDVSAVIEGPVNVNGTVNVGNVVQTQTEVTNNVSTTVSNTVATTVSGTVDTVVSGPVSIAGTVPITGDVAVTGPVSVSGSVAITSGDIDATITGPVTIGGAVQVGGIDTPVRVQGGGQVLVDTTGSVTPTADATVTVPAPANGMTYYGVGIDITMTSSSADNLPFTIYVYSNGPGSPVRLQCGIITGGVGSFGKTSSVTAVVPVATTFPFDIDIECPSGTKGFSCRVVGLSHADSFPRDFTQWENGTEPEISFDSAAANSFALIASSLESREFLIVNAGGTGANFVVDALNSDGSWSAVQNRAHNRLYGGAVGAGTMPANSTSLVTIPGTGRMHRIRTNTAISGAIRLSYIGKA